MKRYVLIVLISFLFFIPTYSALDIEIKSENALLYNLKDHEIIYEKNSEKQTYIASLTKIVTILIALENIEDINEKIILKDNIFKGLVEKDASVAGFKVGEEVTYKDLLYGAMLPSGADATNALAINLFGDEQNYVNEMNQLIKKLNIKNTYFINTSGLDEIGQKATLKDLLTITLYAFKNEDFLKIFTTKNYKTSNNRLNLNSTLRFYEKKYDLDTNIITGGKTGYTDLAGLCLLSYTKKDDFELLLITTNAPVTENRYPYNVTDALNIYNHIFENYHYFTILSNNQTITKISNKYSNQSFTDAKYVGDDFKMFLSKKITKKDINYNFDTKKVVNPFTDINKPVGKFDIKYQDKEIFSGDLFLAEKVSFSLLIFIKENIKAIIFSFIVIIVLFFKRKKRFYGNR
ncbi:MAG: serine hydrolase [Bacilli bacterium]|nr:serine hydrolase [Bacilli bacterium]